MKKIFSVVVALTMLFALCVPAFAGTAVDAMPSGSAKTFAQEIVKSGANFASDEVDFSIDLTVEPAEDAGEDEKEAFNKTKAAVAVLQNAANTLKINDVDTDVERSQIASLTANALVTDGLLTETQRFSFQTKAIQALENAYNSLGLNPFDPSDVVDNVADGFGNDLGPLFDTLRNTISDLSDRLSDAFRDNSSGGDNNPGGDNNNNNTTDKDDTFGGKESTGDTAIYAVAGVAAVAAVALVLTKKKMK